MSIETPRATGQRSEAGDRAALTIALLPHGFEPVFSGARGHVPSELDELQAYLQGGTAFDAWLRDVTQGARASEVPGALEWAGLDPARPIFIRVGEAPDSLVSAASITAGQPSMMRHVMALPTTEENALRAQLRAFTARCREEGAVFRCPGMGSVRFVSGDGWLFVVFHPLSEGEDLDAEALMGTIGGAASWALEGRAAIGGFLRPASIRGAATHYGGSQVAGALLNADPSIADVMRSAALGELAGAFLRSSAYGHELNAIGFRVESDPLTLAVSADLTEAGRQRWAHAASEPSSPDGQAPPLVIQTSLDISGIVAGAPVPFGYAEFTDLTGVRNAFRECGVACFARGLIEPAAHMHLVTMERPLAEMAGPMARFETNPALPTGTLNVDVDLAALFAPLAIRGSLAIRSRIEGNRWSGGIGMSPDDAGTALARAQQRPAAPVQTDDGAPDSLRCLDGVGTVTSGYVRSMSRVDEPTAEMIESGRAHVTRRAECVVDPRHAADRDGYVQVYEMAAELMRSRVAESSD